VIVRRYGSQNQQAFIFPSHAVAARCLSFVKQRAFASNIGHIRVVDLVTVPGGSESESDDRLAHVSAVLFPSELIKVAKAFWQHTGEGISSRRAEYCRRYFDNGRLVEKSCASAAGWRCRGPRRYQGNNAIERQSQDDINGQKAKLQSLNDSKGTDNDDRDQFLEERFGRILDLGFAQTAKLAIKRRIAGFLTANVSLKDALIVEPDKERTRSELGFAEHNIYLYPTGMSSIFNTHRTLLAARGEMKSITYGWESCSYTPFYSF
jgi:cystathionine gamma-synthase